MMAVGQMFAPRTDDNRTEGDFSSRARRFSLYTWLETHPTVTRIGMLAGVAVFLAGRKRTATGRSQFSQLRKSEAAAG